MATIALRTRWFGDSGPAVMLTMPGMCLASRVFVIDRDLRGVGGGQLPAVRAGEHDDGRRARYVPGLRERLVLQVHRPDRLVVLRQEAALVRGRRAGPAMSGSPRPPRSPRARSPATGAARPPALARRTARARSCNLALVHRVPLGSRHGPRRTSPSSRGRRASRYGSGGSRDHEEYPGNPSGAPYREGGVIPTRHAGRFPIAPGTCPFYPERAVASQPARLTIFLPGMQRGRQRSRTRGAPVGFTIRACIPQAGIPQRKSMIP